MQDLVKRYFWVVGALTVMVSAYFVARTTANLAEASFLADEEHGPKIEPVAAARPSSEPRRSKSGEPIASRNIFCSDCVPEEVGPAVNTPVDPNVIPETSLPLVLVATSVGPTPESSFATIQNSSTQAMGAFWSGEEIPAAGKVEVIKSKYVDFRSTTTNRLERISLFPEGPKPMTPTGPVALTDNPVATENPDEMTAALDAGIKKIDDSNYEIDRSLVDKLLSNPLAVSKGARVVPSVKNGKANGIKLYAIRPSSVYAKIGLSNGDTIHAINSFELNSLDKGLEIYSKLKDASSLQVEITRRGKPMTINYSVH
jgi:general secretion pathway protein C